MEKLKEAFAAFSSGNLQIEDLLKSLASYIDTDEFMESYDQPGASDWAESLDWCNRAVRTLNELAEDHPQV
jgi:hypothetical protein